MPTHYRFRTSARITALSSTAAFVGLAYACAAVTSGPQNDDPSEEGGDAGARRIPRVSPRPSLDAGPFEGTTTPTCIEADGVLNEASQTLDAPDVGRASVTVQGEGCTRSFSLQSTAERPADFPASPRELAESADAPSLHTTHSLFDALYQLALAEARENSVSEIRDGSFANGNPVACGEGGCFETGLKWKYAWTRDTAYASHLGLGWFDPVRAKNSLEFKLSLRRDGSDLQIVQDTGTGGSYPVSTDRAVWALGAREILQHLTGQTRTAFRDKALTAIKNTIAHDRVIAFDTTDGLYRGEQSFLDWREQSYPNWVKNNTAAIATSKALSTNLVHYALLQTGAALATEVGDSAKASELSGWANALRRAIQAKFWLPENNLFSTFVTTQLDPSPARQFDLLGTSLAVALGVATPEQAKLVIANYPTLPSGPPVIFPQQQETRIYHNRAIWPFVTAYWAKAAKLVRNDAAFEAAVRSLMRGAALNLSNVENLELATGKPYLSDGEYSGPEVNSPRQLWSVAGYIGLIHNELFGLSLEDARGLRVNPYLTQGLRNELFPGASTIVLNNVAVRDKKATIVVKLPPPRANAKGSYKVARLWMNGTPITDGLIRFESFAERNLIDVELVEDSAAPLTVRTIEAKPHDRVLYAPKTPSVAVSSGLQGNKVTLTIDTKGEASGDIEINVYRDGQAVATNLAGSTTRWSDPTSNGDLSPSYCYTVETKYILSGNVSQRANPACFWGSNNSRIITVASNSFNSLNKSTTNNTSGEWGDPSDQITAPFTLAPGDYMVQTTYANGAHRDNTGITCAVKNITVETSTNRTVGSGFLILPHTFPKDACPDGSPVPCESWGYYRGSNFVKFKIDTRGTYTIRIFEDQSPGKRHAINMSAFNHFNIYNGSGGQSGASSRVNISEIKVFRLTP